MSWKQKVGNRLGCGYIPHKDEIFFTYKCKECYDISGEKEYEDGIKLIQGKSR